MRSIVERAMLIRGSVRLPGDLELETEAFGEGLSFVQSGDSHWLDKEIRAADGISSGLLNTATKRSRQNRAGSHFRHA